MSILQRAEAIIKKHRLVGWLSTFAVYMIGTLIIILAYPDQPKIGFVAPLELAWAVIVFSFWKYKGWI